MGYIEDKVYWTPVPDIDTLAVVTEEMLEKTWKEFEYILDVLRATNGAYVEVY
jgi:hypothetical protein